MLTKTVMRGEAMSENVGKCRITPRQEAAIRVLLTGATVETAAEQVGVHRRSIERWRKEKPFRAALDQARKETLEAALDGVRNISAQAVRTLEASLSADHSAVALRAAVATLDICRSERDRNLEERVADIEERIQNGQIDVKAKGR